MDSGSLIPSNSHNIREFRSDFAAELNRPLAPVIHALPTQESVLREYFRILRKRLWVVVTSVAVIVGAIAVATLRSTRIYEAMAVFVALIGLQILAGRTAYRYQTIHQAMLYGAYGLLCFLVVQCLRKSSQVTFLTYAATVYGFGIAVFAIFQGISSSGQLYWFVTPSSGGWIYGPYVNHNHYAGLMPGLAMRYLP